MMNPLRHDAADCRKCYVFIVVATYRKWRDIPRIGHGKAS